MPRRRKQISSDDESSEQAASSSSSDERSRVTCSTSRRTSSHTQSSASTSRSNQVANKKQKAAASGKQGLSATARKSASSSQSRFSQAASRSRKRSPRAAASSQSDSDSASLDSDTDCIPPTPSASVLGNHSGSVRKGKPVLVKNKNPVGVSDVRIEKLANDFVHYLLVADQKKYAIKRVDIVKHVFGDIPEVKNIYAQVLNRANILLQQVYGLELQQIENQKYSYMVVNKLTNAQDLAEYSDEKIATIGLIWHLIVLIFMNGNSIKEAALWNALKVFGIDPNERKPHPIFGDVKKLITGELVRQMYLKYECINKETSDFEFSWGFRVKQEVDKRSLLKFVSEITDTEEKDWLTQFQEVLRDEERMQVD